MPSQETRPPRAADPPATGSEPSEPTPAAPTPSEPPPPPEPEERAEQADATTVEPTGEKPPEEIDDERLIIVGVGASAGGLEALGELIEHIPIDSMAFIVVQHLAPHHESVLTQLLARGSRLEVLTASDGMDVEAGHIYVIPPNADLAVMHGVIRLMEPAGIGLRLPIDYLFRSLAEDKGRAAIGVVLSGTGTDGTFGIKAIKGAGGLTFVQDPASARYDGMPRSALASGSADFCLTPAEIGEELSRIAERPRWRPPSPAAVPARDQIGKLFALIRSESGNDLSQYKAATVERRIERRMTLLRIEQLDQYVRYVQSSRDELRALYDDMLITVTSFFRDPTAFEALKKNVLPQLAETKKPHEAIRVWVPACASGEEAYSIAMCLLEVLDTRARDQRIQIFGTDIDEKSIQRARRGVYPANIAADVSPERLTRFFTKKDDEYVIARAVRDTVVFSNQNVLRDAPFSRLDLVSCRNLLIYLQPPAQKKVLRVLHYALNPAGHLLLGASETASEVPDLFAPIDRKNKIYVKRHAPPQVGLDTTFGVPSPRDTPIGRATARPTMSLQAVADRKVLELYGPPGVVINEELEILQFRGHTGAYFDPIPGIASLNVLRLARFELHIELKGLIDRAFSGRLRVTSEVRYYSGGKPCIVELDAIPLDDPETKARCVLLLFHEMTPSAEIQLVPRATAEDGDETVQVLVQRIKELERDVAVTKEYLQATVEEKDSTTEELKSANEELQSSNEELQSTNEELETSREEMQSTNEELTTVNDELNRRMIELGQANDDLHNVLAGVDNAVVIVGMDRRIRRYTVAAERLFNLVPGDAGRTIDFLDPFVGAGMIEPKVAAVIDNLATVEDEFVASNRRWYALKIVPYKTLEHSIRGAVISLTDIDVQKRAAEMTRDVGAYAARFLAAINHPLLIIDKKLRIVWCNDRFLEVFQRTSEETVGSVFSDLGGAEWTERDLRDRIDRLFTTGGRFRQVMLGLKSPEFVQRRFVVGGGPIPATPEMPLVLLSLEPLEPGPHDETRPQGGSP